MKLAQEMRGHLNTITAYSPDCIKVNDAPYTQSLVISPHSLHLDWILEDLSADLFAQLCQQKPEVVLLGTGPRLIFPHPRLYQALTQAQIGVEVMDTAAACRTYNILMAEDRNVWAILLLAS